MKEKKNIILTIIRLISLVLLEVGLYRKCGLDVIFTAITVTAICFWVLPHILTSFVCYIFKIKGEYGGVLQYDDSDPTDCRFRMIFNFDPEFLIGNDEFAVKVEKTELRGRNSD